MATFTLIRTPKRRQNKLQTNERDVAKRRRNKLQSNESDEGHEKREESCNKFVMMDDNKGFDIHPIQAKYMNPPSA